MKKSGRHQLGYFFPPREVARVEARRNRKHVFRVPSEFTGTNRCGSYDELFLLDQPPLSMGKDHDGDVLMRVS
jgi:hypothetical protein